MFTDKYEFRYRERSIYEFFRGVLRLLEFQHKDGVDSVPINHSSVSKKFPTEALIEYNKLEKQIGKCLNIA